MSSANRIDRWAKLSLLFALGLAIIGVILEHYHFAPFVGGLLLAFGEAALVGGLADWFAVRALFTHPFGIPFPHSALIPRNRRRIVAELRSLVENEWLPRPMLQARINEFDFVGDLLLPFFAAQKETLQGLFRTAAKNVLDDVAPPRIAAFLARAAGHALETEQLAPFLAQVAHRARDEEWLEPIIREWLKRLVEWAGSEESHAIIHRHLEEAGVAYRTQGWFRSFTYQVAEVFGGLDLHNAATLLQNEIKRFAIEQGGEKSPLQKAVAEGLKNVEYKLVNDPNFIRGLRGFLVETSDAGTLPALFAPMITAVKAEGLRELDRPNSPLLRWVVERLERWLKQVEADPVTREQVNNWCRQLAGTVIDKHHGVIGLLVEEQLNRLSDENLVVLIEQKVGEDLNWIRLNGTFVGGLIGVALFLLFRVLRAF
jgi:uncharacterized membrane-anchored protein YjiN (DUF445 family)